MLCLRGELSWTSSKINLTIHFSWQDRFDSEEFYVFKDKPYCQYHYHLENNSFCADPSCQQPIEGPCMIFGGSRYHPEHFPEGEKVSVATDAEQYESRCCRRCGLLIGNKAVWGSIDGVLTGKYHMACFTCHTCQVRFSVDISKRISPYMFFYPDRTGSILGNFTCLTTNHTANTIMTLKAISLVRAIMTLTAIPCARTLHAKSLLRARV